MCIVVLWTMLSKGSQITLTFSDIHRVVVAGTEERANTLIHQKRQRTHVTLCSNALEQIRGSWLVTGGQSESICLLQYTH